MAILTLSIGILIIVVVGAICFWAIDKFAPDGRWQVFLNCWLCSFAWPRLCNDF